MSGSKQAINSSVDYGRHGSQNRPSVRSRSGPQISGTGDTRPECRAIVDNGLVCGETQTLRITDELKKLYENRLQKLDEDIGKDASGDSGQLQLKVKVLQNWVQDLLEQNAELVHTVEELEREIGYRVKLLEEKLMESARTCREYMTKVHDYESEMRDVAADKEKEEHLQIRLGNLKSDICNLLKVICHARERGEWNADGFVFYEVTQEDIFRCSPLAVQQVNVPAATLEAETVVLPLPPKTPRKVKLSLELAMNRVNANSTTSYDDDATKPSPLTYQWTFEPPNQPCTCNPKK